MEPALPSPFAIPVVIAAGGLGLRIGGGKPGRVLGGETLLAHAVRFARAQGGPVAVAGAHDAAVPGIDVPLLADEIPGLGPIAALRSAFAFAARVGAERVLMIGCDMPSLPVDLCARLDVSIGAAGAAVPVCGGRDQPLAALWRVDQPALDAAIAAGLRAPLRFAEQVGCVRVAWPLHGDPFLNVNDSATLALAEDRLRRTD